MLPHEQGQAAIWEPAQLNKRIHGGWTPNICAARRVHLAKVHKFLCCLSEIEVSQMIKMTFDPEEVGLNVEVLVLKISNKQKILLKYL